MGNFFRRAAQGVRNVVGRITGGRAGTRQIAQRASGRSARSGG
jgi:hypothetical protein